MFLSAIHFQYSGYSQHFGNLDICPCFSAKSLFKQERDNRMNDLHKCKRLNVAQPFRLMQASI